MKRTCGTCMDFRVIDKKSDFQWGTCIRSDNDLTEEQAAADGYPCWRPKKIQSVSIHFHSHVLTEHYNRDLILADVWTKTYSSDTCRAPICCVEGIVGQDCDSCLHHNKAGCCTRKREKITTDELFVRVIQALAKPGKKEVLAVLKNGEGFYVVVDNSLDTRRSDVSA